MLSTLRKITDRLLLVAVTLVLPYAHSAETSRWRALKSSSSVVDGMFPTGNGIVIGNQFFGVTVQGGAGGMGILYKVSLDGTGFVKLRDFAASEGETTSVYAGPLSSLVGVGNTVFGALYDGIDSKNGMLYKIDADGQNWMVLKQFADSAGTDGAYPTIQFGDGEVIYGTCRSRGLKNRGTLFRIKADGTEFTVIHSFELGSPIQILGDGNVIYGFTDDGSIFQKLMTVFKINKDGTGFQQLKNFSGDDAMLQSLAISGNTIVGCSAAGGVPTRTESNPRGYVFSLQKDGSDFQILKTFGSMLNYPQRLVTEGRTIYGWCGSGMADTGMGGLGSSTGGLFQIKIDGSEYQTLSTGTWIGNFAAVIPGQPGLLYDNGQLLVTSRGGVSSFNLGTPADPKLFQTAMYGGVKFSGTLHSLVDRRLVSKTFRSVTTTTEATDLITVPLTNLVVLQRMLKAGLLQTTVGYSIVCSDDGNLKFYAYKKGFPLVDLSSQISFTEIAAVQGVRTESTFDNQTSATTKSETGTEKSHCTGNFFGMKVSMSRSVAFRSAAIKSDKETFLYYPSTSQSYFFGADAGKSEYVEGRFIISAPSCLQTQ